MSGAENRNHFENDQLWDETGRVWRRKRTGWLTAQDANRWTKRRARAALYGVEGRAVTWLAPDEVRPFWHRIKTHFDVPGTYSAEPDAEGNTYSAHIWRSGDDRLLGFQTHC